MRVMLDTNVLISALLFPSNKMDEIINFISSEHDLILSSFVVDELKAVVASKFPSKTETIDMLLANMDYELVCTPDIIPKGLFKIRDEKDYPVLYTAIVGNTDVLITGDKDFADVDISRPEICTPAQFSEKYIED